MNDAEKLIELSKLCELLALEQSDTPEAHGAEAAALARELFPPMAKALVWEYDNWKGEYFSGGYRIARTHKMATPQIKAQCFAVRLRGGVNIDGKLFDSEREARRFAEAHHQAHWLEQMA
jgi:hypothetical protein